MTQAVAMIAGLGLASVAMAAPAAQTLTPEQLAQMVADSVATTFVGNPDPAAAQVEAKVTQVVLTSGAPQNVVTAACPLTRPLVQANNQLTPNVSAALLRLCQLASNPLPTGTAPGAAGSGGTIGPAFSSNGGGGGATARYIPGSPS